jgi:hypothetical protein
MSIVMGIRDDREGSNLVPAENEKFSNQIGYLGNANPEICHYTHLHFSTCLVSSTHSLFIIILPSISMFHTAQTVQLSRVSPLVAFH